MNPTDDEIPPCDIRVDKEGIWYYRGAEIVRRDIVELFYRHLERDDLGRYIIHLRGQKCYLEVQDTPFVVWETSITWEEEEPKEILLHLSDGTVENLDPASLYVGDLSVPYCRIGAGEKRARFSRKAYYQIARIVEADDNGQDFYLRLGPRRYRIPV